MTYSLASAMALAEEWKAAVLAKGSFTEIAERNDLGDGSKER